MNAITIDESPAVMKRGLVKPKALFLLEEQSFGMIYGKEEQGALGELLEFYAPPQTGDTVRGNMPLLENAEIIISGWGVPRMDAAFLRRAPNLQAVFHGAGSIRSFTTDAFWDRGIVVTSAYAANAVPVAEYTLSVTLLSLKKMWSYAAGTKRGEGWGDHTRVVPGNFRSTLGLISCGMVARKTIELLAAFDLRCLVACPFLTEAEARSLKVERCSLDEIFQRADVVSLHTPELPETRGMVTGRHFASMKHGATFINTARGALVRQDEMIEVLRQRHDLTAVLDVTHPEPPEPDCPLLGLPNVIVTPHIAGSMSPECRRLGSYMVEEVKRFIAGEPLRWQITEEAAARLA